MIYHGPLLHYMMSSFASHDDPSTIARILSLTIAAGDQISRTARSSPPNLRRNLTLSMGSHRQA